MTVRSIELEENLQRKDMDWQEQIKLQQEIHNLQVEIHGEKTSTSSNAQGFSITDTAKLLKKDKSTVARDLQLAQAVEQFPEVQWDECKNKAEALKLKKKLEEKVIRAELAKRAQKSLGSSSNVLRKQLANAYIVKSFFDGVKQIPTGSINLVEIDPPYAIDLQGQKKDYNYTGYNEVDPQFYEQFMTKVFEEAYRVLADNTWLICWFGPDWFAQIKQWLLMAGFTPVSIPCIWTKPNGQTNNPSRRLASAYEMFFYAAKGSPVLAKPGAINIFDFKPVPPTQKIHPTERPLDMITEVLTTFALEGSRVLVPFAGSGNTLIAAAQNKMVPIGYDITDEYRESYLIRLAEIFQ